MNVKTIIKKNNIIALLLTITLSCTSTLNTKIPQAGHGETQQKTEARGKKILVAGGYTALGIGATCMGVYTIMMCHLFCGIRLFAKPSKISHLLDTAGLAAAPTFVCGYTAYRMFKNAYKALKK